MGVMGRGWWKGEQLNTLFLVLFVLCYKVLAYQRSNCKANTK